MLRSKPRADTLSPCASHCQSVVLVQITGGTSPPPCCNGDVVLHRLALHAARSEPLQYPADYGYQALVALVVQQHHQLVSAPDEVLLSSVRTQPQPVPRNSRAVARARGDKTGPPVSPDDSRSSASSSGRTSVLRCRSSGTSAWRFHRETHSSQTTSAAASPSPIA